MSWSRSFKGKIAGALLQARQAVEEIRATLPAYEQGQPEAAVRTASDLAASYGIPATAETIVELGGHQGDRVEGENRIEDGKISVAISWRLETAVPKAVDQGDGAGAAPAPPEA